ncbi:hypothetical protein FHL15_009199 [Xylaria flabelliformis]|uniref:HNH nuclease domain-containing protein n=1 Tax=Xylaria flabelliformis TaxID=2512241 RepID=A0A553HPQ0_9PEZI|nr:hypothetical protein FHL15_009199 [Xylaria flabelliformis]
MPRPQSEQSSCRAVGGRKFIAFFHPSYPDTAPPLLTLAAIDYVLKGARIIRGIDYDTAKAACGIVACNRYDEGAYFALKDRRGVYTRLDRPVDGLLHAGGDVMFYFIVDTPIFRYPVVPSFDHWRFPHGGLPSRWARLPGPQHMIDGLDSRVGCDGIGDPLCLRETDIARVAPFSHMSWCDSNLMEKFCRKHGAGVPCLSTDIQRCFSYRRMDLIPNHRFRPKRFELHPELLLQDIKDTVARQVWSNDHSPIRFDSITREHLFASFAFHILSEANYKFLSGCLKYTVRLFDIKTAEELTVELDGDNISELSQIFPSPITTTPQYPDSDGFDGSDELDESDDDADSTCSQESSSYDYPYYTSERRQGRKRCRSPAYHRYKDRLGRSQQGQNDAVHTPLLQARTSLHHTSSFGGRSLSSTLSISSLDTPHTGQTPDYMAICDDTPGNSTEMVGSKRSYDDYSETPDVAQFHKRLCLR